MELYGITCGMTDLPPEGFGDEEKSDASTSQELPVVVLGELDEPAEQPRARLLPGRVPPKWILYPAMVLQLVAGLIALLFAFGSAEWAPTPILLTWLSLILWTWFYGIAYRYRRVLLKYGATLTLIATSFAVAAFCLDRGARQLAFDGQRLTERAAAPSLTLAAVLTVGAACLIVSHIVFFGRGYREKPT